MARCSSLKMFCPCTAGRGKCRGIPNALNYPQYSTDHTAKQGAALKTKQAKGVAQCLIYSDCPPRTPTCKSSNPCKPNLSRKAMNATQITGNPWLPDRKSV